MVEAVVNAEGALRSAFCCFIRIGTVLEGDGGMSENINTQSYWEERFSSGDWEANLGRWQTEQLARAQVRHFPLPNGFQGTILDFGCGMGDAIPVFKAHFPNASLLGIDVSPYAIEECRTRFGSIATFLTGDVQQVPQVDFIVCSNVLEHLTDHLDVATHLRAKSKMLCIAVPYKEHPMIDEHVNRYDKTSFRSLGPHDYRIFTSRGWSYYGRELWYHQYAKNLCRFVRREPLHFQRWQIMYRFT